MQIDDMILVSVDDHVVEPPGMWDDRVPKKYADEVPKLVTKEDGNDVWSFRGAELPNIGLNAVPGRQEGLSRRHVLGEPWRARLSEPALRALGSVLEGVLRREHDRVPAHRLVVEDGRHRRRRADQRDDHVAADEPRAGGVRPVVVTRVAEVPRPEVRDERGRHRLDPVLP